MNGFIIPATPSPPGCLCRDSALEIVRLWMLQANPFLGSPSDYGIYPLVGYYELQDWFLIRADIRNATAAFSSSNNAGNRPPPVVIRCAPNFSFDNLVPFHM